MQYAPVERTSVASSMRILPRSINDFERDIFIRRSRLEGQNAHFRVIGLVNFERRSDSAIDKIWVKDIEFISLYSFRRWIVAIVVSSVVLGPVKSCISIILKQ